MFTKAKAFSDFIGFHVRFQFVMLSALLVLAPEVVRLNTALRDNIRFVPNSDPIDFAAVICLITYGFILLFFICGVGIGFVKRKTIDKTKGTARWAVVPLFLVLCAVFIFVELIANGAILWAGFSRILDAFGVSIDEIKLFSNLFWQRACLHGTTDCN